MLIRTHKTAAAKFQPAAGLSLREKRRLANTIHPEGKHTAVPTVEAEPIKEEIREEIPVEAVKEESAVVAETVAEFSENIAEPGTAMIRSKVLEELEASKTQKPKKKYKIISIQK